MNTFILQDDVEQDLSDVRVLLADWQERSDGHEYRKAAQIILLKILHLDPTHSEAKAILATIRASVEPPQQPARISGVAPKPKTHRFEELEFTAQSTRVWKKPEPKNSGVARKFPIVLASFVLLGGGLFFYRANSASPNITAEAAVETPVPDLPQPASLSIDHLPLPDDSSNVAPAPTDPRVAASPVVAAPTGFLAVSSTAPAEIYLEGKYLGDTPKTLELPAGTQTLEYRHGDLRTTATHEIKAKETVTALVGFDVIVRTASRLANGLWLTSGGHFDRTQGIIVATDWCSHVLASFSSRDLCLLPSIRFRNG